MKLTLRLALGALLIATSGYACGDSDSPSPGTDGVNNGTAGACQLVREDREKRLDGVVTHQESYAYDEQNRLVGSAWGAVGEEPFAWVNYTYEGDSLVKAEGKREAFDEPFCMQWSYTDTTITQQESVGCADDPLSESIFTYTETDPRLSVRQPAANGHRAGPLDFHRPDQKQRLYGPEGFEVNGTTSYTYDEDDRVTGERFVDQLGVATRTAYTYTELGDLASVSTDYEDDGTEDDLILYLYTYDDGHVATYEVDRGGDGNINSRRIDERRADGQLLKAEYDRDVDGVIDRTDTWEYDAAGNPIVFEQDEDGDGDPDHRLRFIYECG